MPILYGLILLLVGVILALYVYGKQEGYASPPLPPSQETTIPVVQVTHPYDVHPIRNLDDYEYSAVFENEVPRELSKDLRNKMMSQYPMDWSTNPPSSVNFQKGYSKQKEMFQDLDASGNPYIAMEDESMQPPDTAAMESQERKLLQTYKPSSAGALTTYHIDDAEALIRKIYDAKGEIPQIIKKDSNLYEIVGVQKKDEKIVYEETDETATASAVEETVIQPPQAAADVNAALDPFYETRPETKQGKWNYRSWTPGLERMFPPTEPRKNWY